MRALLRRAPPEPAAAASLRFGDLVVDLARTVARRGEATVKLRRTE